MLGRGGGAGLATLAQARGPWDIGVPPCAPHLHQTSRPLLFGGAEHTVISFCIAKLTGNYQQGEINALEKFRRLSGGKDYQGNI